MKGSASVGNFRGDCNQRMRSEEERAVPIVDPHVRMELNTMDSPSPRAPKTCIVIPCFNEESRIDLPAFESFLAASNDIQLVMVNDGSTDGTMSVLSSLAEQHPGRVRALDLGFNQGKAEAVRQGMLMALETPGVEYAGFWDADLATPLESIALFADVLDRRDDIDVVFGTRVALLGREIERKASRHYFGRIFATAAGLVLSMPVYDTQCGAKLFRNNKRCTSLFERRFGSRWIFDVELVARYVHGRTSKHGIYEMPLDRWRDVGDSRVRPRDFV